MKFNSVFKAAIGFSMLASISIGGCANTPPTHFYLLQPASAPVSNVSENDESVCIVIGPVTVPDYLDRPFIVTRLGENKLNIDEFHQWAEPLESNFARVLGENLSGQLATEQLAYFPARRSFPADYRVVVNIIRFDSDQNGETILLVRWRVLNSKSGEVVAQKRSSFRETSSLLTYDAIAAAMGRNLEKLSLEIASVIEGDR